MKVKMFMMVMFTAFSFAVQAQTADEIIANYFENTGGLDKWKALQGLKLTAKVNQGGMEIPLEIYQFRDGRQMTVIKFQGMVIKQGVFDGTNLWSHNFQTMKAEKSDAETTENFKQEVADFPDPFFDYKTHGYTVELLGKETVDGTETYKIKLTKKPIKVDGQAVDNVVFYYFDAESFVPLMMEAEVKSGPQKGVVSQIKWSDYQELSNGMLMPFSMSQGVKDGPSQPIVISTIDVNPQVDSAEFKYPEG